ncbi:MAG: extracellular solute-binding protein [Candidatus Moranbacteria bacterium]|nr:extracellular solute-binding protein [Candidatus Moranbacteria bacterium]
MKKKSLLAFLFMIGILVLSGCGLKQANPKQYTLNLEVWGLFDDTDVFRDIFDAYAKTNPNIGTITYKKLSPDTYKKDLVDALASDQGPDIFLIHNDWLPGFENRTYPAPPEVLNEQKFRDNFVDVAIQDFIIQGLVGAVPLTVDSLGLYYNKDLFNEAGITSPPRNWVEFIEAAKKMTKIDAQGQIVQSGAAMGTAANINRTTDILNLLMLQSGTEMVDTVDRKAKFDQYASQGDSNVSPGENALNFYTQFADSGSAVVPYTWNPRMHYSIDAFSEGTVGMMFNYSWQMDILASKAPKLNYAVAPVPQFTNSPQANFSNYWGYAVAKKRTPDTRGTDPANVAMVTNDVRAAEAWNFLNFLTTRPVQVAGAAPAFDPAIDYLTKTNKPAARRDLIEKQKADVRLGAFVQGNLIAKDWYRSDPDAIETLFYQMIDQINRGQISARDAIKAAAVSVTQIMNQ